MKRLIYFIILISFSVLTANEDISKSIASAKPTLVAIVAKIDANKFAIIGTGFFIDGSGKIATCNHVIDGANQVFLLKAKDLDKSILIGYVTTHEGIPQLNLPVYTLKDTLLFIRASVFKSDKEHDIAILTTRIKNTSFLEFGSYQIINEGDELILLGFPFGFNRIVTHKGMVSYKGKLIISGNPKDSPIDGLQIDGIVNRGNSGGPLISPSQNKVVGVVKATHGNIGPYLQAINKGEIRTEGIGLGQIDFGKFTREVSSAIDRHIQMGIGYAVSINYLKTLINK